LDVRARVRVLERDYAMRRREKERKLCELVSTTDTKIDTHKKGKGWLGQIPSVSYFTTGLLGYFYNKRRFLINERMGWVASSMKRFPRILFPLD
jgi:hypothetical protein